MAAEQSMHVGNTNLDRSKAEAFGNRMLTLLNNGATALMISIGHKAGLFEVMAALPPGTSTDLASAASLNERYVREWLVTMYVSGIVEMETKGDGDAHEGKQVRLYSLPPENAAFLTWGRGPENVAVLSQYVSILSAYEARTVECFRTGRGVDGNKFAELKAIIAADAAQTISASLVDWILLLGGGEISSDLEDGVDVLDIQCGAGMNMITMAKSFPNSWFTGYDRDPANLRLAKEAAEQEGLTNIRFKYMDFVESAEISAYDLITCFGCLAESGDIRSVVNRAFSALREQGSFFIQDIASSSDVRANRAHPAGPLMYAVSVMFALPVSIANSKDEKHARGLMWGNDSIVRLLREVGFKCDGPKTLPDDHCNAFFFCMRP
jgi:2-polyprenyl-3-methyl-5-hydroxy-6-metoxy-1,4-benzoquinol methylase